MKRIAILHYTSPPTIGGVELTIAHHARELVRSGFEVRVISGMGSLFEPHVEIFIDPLFSSTNRQYLAIKPELDSGEVPFEFEALVTEIYNTLQIILFDCDVLIVHNVTTLHKNLAFTSALDRFNQSTDTQVISWVHDLAWTNSQYLSDLHDRYPWNLLRQAWPKVQYVTVSEPRRQELADLLRLEPDAIKVIAPGVDYAQFFRWTPSMEQIVEQLCLLNADGLLLLPARITRRKNIELAIEVLGWLRKTTDRDFRLVVTGPLGPHNPANSAYLDELILQCQSLGLEQAVHFLYTLGEQPLFIDDETMANLYLFADALVFPSTQEGFGIPILEAGAAGLPVICADIPAFRATAQADGVFFDADNDSADVIASIVLNVLDSNPICRLRQRIRRTYRWDVIVREQLLPLLEA